jgi:hypothetical protein
MQYKSTIRTPHRVKALGILADLMATQAKHNEAISNSIVDAAKRLDELTPCLHARRRFLK